MPRQKYDHLVIAKQREEGLEWKTIGEAYGVDGDVVRTAHGHYMKQHEPLNEIPEPSVFPDYKWPEDVNWREYLNLWDKLLQLERRADPYVETFTIDLSYINRPIAMVSASDLHMGGGFTDHKAIRATMDFVFNTPDMYLGISGDSIEGFIPGVKPAETVEQQVSSVKAQLRAAESLVKDLIADGKLWWWTWGDHDAKWFEQRIGLNIVQTMLKHQVPYFTGRGLVRLLLGDQEYFIQVNHGERYASQWNPNHPQRRAYERFFPADVTISGHLHKPAFQMFHHYDQLREAGINLGGKTWLVQNGTFKTGPDPYTIRSWSRGIMGVPTIVFRPDCHDCDVLETPEKAARIMT